MENIVELIAGTLGDEIFVYKTDEIDFDTFLKYAKDDVIEQIDEEAVHGEIGADEKTSIFKYKDEYYAVTVSDVEYDRLDKQFYFRSNYHTPTVKWVKITPKFATNGIIDDEWIHQGEIIINNKKVLSEDDVFYPLEFIEEVEEISLPQLLQIQHILKVKNYELNQFGFNVVI